VGERSKTLHNRKRIIIKKEKKRGEWGHGDLGNIHPYKIKKNKKKNP
jgi:hypothetical protein